MRDSSLLCNLGLRGLRHSMLLFVWLSLLCGATGQSSEGVLWISQFGTSAEETPGGIVVDAAGNAYISGGTGGNLSGTGSAGGSDIFLTRLSPEGTLTRSTQRGGPYYDVSYEVALGGDGQVWVAGVTGGYLDGSPYTRSIDAALLAFGTDGSHSLTDVFGGTSVEVFLSVATTADSIYAAGYTVRDARDVLITKYNLEGEQQWRRGFGTNMDDYVAGIATNPDGSVVVVGNTAGDLLGPRGGFADVFLGKWDAQGNQLFLRTFDLSVGESAIDMKVDLFGNIYIAGHTSDLMTYVSDDDYAFISKHDPDGNLLWMGTYGTVGGFNEVGLTLEVTAEGGVWLGGYRSGPFSLIPGGKDGFVARFDDAGNFLYDLTFDSGGVDRIEDLALGPNGDLWAMGQTNGSLGTGNLGSYDIFVARIVPEPSTTILLCAGAVTLIMRRRRS